MEQLLRSDPFPEAFKLSPGQKREIIESAALVAGHTRPRFKILDLRDGSVDYESPRGGWGDLVFSADGENLYVLGQGEFIRFDTDSWEPLARISESRRRFGWSRRSRVFVDAAGACVYSLPSGLHTLREIRGRVRSGLRGESGVPS